jgi:hypothetical protein
MAVRDEKAAATLARIASGELSRCVLPWVALMSGSGEAAVLDEWKRLADLEPNLQVRLDYAADALVFAELPDVQAEWRKALEGWNVRESQFVIEMKNEAKVELRQEVLLRLLEQRCKQPVPGDIASVIQATQDLSRLSQWFDAAANISSFDEFRSSTATP